MEAVEARSGGELKVKKWGMFRKYLTFKQVFVLEYKWIFPGLLNMEVLNGIFLMEYEYGIFPVSILNGIFTGIFHGIFPESISWDIYWNMTDTSFSLARWSRKGIRRKHDELVKLVGCGIA